MLITKGNTFTAKSIVTAVVTSSRGKEIKEIQLGSGWVSWWKLARFYNVDGPGGFNKVYASEKNGNITENNLKSNIKIVLYYKSFECFGYVNLEKVFEQKDITEMVATTPGDFTVFFEVKVAS